MAKFKLDIGDTLKESLLFWVTRYLLYKATTLSNAKADKEFLQQALVRLRPTPSSFEELITVAREVQKAGVGVYTLFYPAWLWARENENNPDFTSLKDIDEESVMHWLSVATSSKSDATKRNYKVALQDFFNYLSRYNEDKFYFDIDLSKWQRNLPNALKKTPAYLTEEEIAKFLKNLDKYVVYKRGKGNKIDPYSTALHRAIFKLALASGMRVSEIIELSKKDVSIDENNDLILFSIKRAKGNKYRTVVTPYSQGMFALKQEFQAYFAIANCKEYLFCSKNGKKIHRKTLDLALKRYLVQLGIKKEKMGMHLLRHSHATFFYSKTKDPVLLQERLGHSDMQTTKKYIHIDQEKHKKGADVLR